MSTPRVSIITPVLNGLPHLRATWRSVRAQTFRDWEWLVADDGSTDGTPAWLEALAAREPRVRVLPGEHAGKCAAFNRALEQARGEFVALLDADDLWERGKLERQVAQLEANASVQVSYTWAQEFWSEESGRDDAPRVVWRRIPQPGNLPEYLLAVGQPACTSSLVFRREALVRIGGMNERIPVHDDHELILRAARELAIELLPEVLVRYRITPGSRTARRTADRLIAFHEELVREGFNNSPGWRRHVASHHLRLAEYALDGGGREPWRLHAILAVCNNIAEFKRWVLLPIVLLPGGIAGRAYKGLKRWQARRAGHAVAHRFTMEGAASNKAGRGVGELPMRPFVSIIVPAYNEEKRIGTAIEALLALHWPTHRREIIVVDNGSTDSTREVVARYAGRGVRLLVEDNVRSSYACRNLGAASAKGDLLAFTDADSHVDPDWLKEAHRAMRRRDAPYAGTRVVLEATNEPANTADLFEMLTGFDVERAVLVHRYTPTVSLLVTRALFEELRGFDATLYSAGDMEFGVRAHDAGFRQAYAGRAIVRHPTRGSAAALVRKVRRTDYNAMKLTRFKGPGHVTARRLFFFLRNALPPNPFYLPRRARTLGICITPGQHLRVYLLHYRLQLASTVAGLVALLDGKRVTSPRQGENVNRRFTDA